MRRSVGVTTAIVAVCMLTASPAAAEDEPPLSFVESGAVTATCAELASEGVEVAIRNDTGQGQRATLLAADFSDSEGAKVALEDVCGGVHATPASLQIEGGASATVLLGAEAAREGTFTGTLTLSPARGRVVRRSLAIVSAPIPATATPLVESQNARHNHLDPTDQDPIWVPVDLPVTDIPQRPNGSGAATVGALSGSNGAVAVTYDGRRKRLTDTTSLIGLDVSDGTPGSYKGSVDLLPEDPEKGKVSLELTMTTWIFFPALLIGLGIAGGIWMQRQTGLTRPRDQLLTRIEALQSRCEKAEARLCQTSGDKAWGKFGIANVAALQDALKERVLTSAEGPMVKLDEEVLKDLKTRVATVEAQIDLMGEIPEHAGDLEAALAKLRRDRPADNALPAPAPGQPSEPRLVAKAEEGLEGSKVDADELKPLVEAIDTRTAQIGTLRSLVARLAELWAAKQRLEEDLDEERLADLVRSLRRARELVFGAVDAEGLTVATAKLQLAWEAAIDLSLERRPASAPVTAHGLSMPYIGATFAAPHLATPQLEIQTEGVAQVRLLAGPPAAAPPTPPTPPVPPLPEPRLRSAEAARRLSLARWSQTAVVIVVGLIALFSGLEVLYFGKAWGGSWWEWVAALVWGLGIQATVTNLATSVDAAALLRRAPG